MVRFSSMSLVAALLLLNIAPAVAEQTPLWQAYEAPNPPIVKSEHDAISVAHALWAIMTPGIPSESVWQKKFHASLRDGVWEIVEDDPRSMFHIFVGAQDGRFLGTAMID